MPAGDGDTGQPQPTQGPDQAPPTSLTRDDAAGQQALGGGDLLLERAEEGSVTLSYYRIFLRQNGSFKYVEVTWSQESGEICDKVVSGTWQFAEGYSYTESGGGTAVKITENFNGQTGQDVLVFNNQAPNAVFVGPKGTRYDRNPNMLDNC